MNFILLVGIAVGLSLIMSLAWGIQRATGASGWIDTIWSFAVGLGGVAAALFAEGDGTRRIVVLVAVAIWSIRLGTHIAMRTHGGGEDPRYAKLIEQWGASASSQLFIFLQIQAAAAFVLVLSIYLAAANSAPFPRIFDVVAMLVVVSAIGGEALADAQLARFRKTPEAKTEICETGLWRYSRHPNYFFEWLGWCAWPLFAITFSSGWSWLSLLAPIQMYVLLVHVSGIPPLEDHMLRSRGEKFRDLQSRVSAFFPAPPERKT